MKVIEQELVDEAFKNYPMMYAVDFLISVSKLEIRQGIDSKIWFHKEEYAFTSGFINSKDVGVRYLDYKDLSK